MSRRPATMGPFPCGRLPNSLSTRPSPRIIRNTANKGSLPPRKDRSHTVPPPDVLVGDGRGGVANQDIELH